VRHWAAGAKEARISQAGVNAASIITSDDERTGDIIHEALQADFRATEYDPMRLAQPATAAEKKIAPGRVRLGPDWLPSWATGWRSGKRTGDTKWRDKILAGVRSLGEMPLGCAAAGTWCSATIPPRASCTS